MKHKWQNSEFSDHRIKDCKKCWDTYPTKCTCGGMIHAVFGEENVDSYSLLHECTKCGDDYKIERDW